MKAIVFSTVLMLVIFTSTLQAETPIILLQDEPTKGQLEIYEDNEDIFALTVLNFYHSAVMLETQVKMLGGVPCEHVLQPTLEDITDLDGKIILKYYKQAAALNKQIMAMPPSYASRLADTVSSLRTQLAVNWFNHEKEIGRIKYGEYLERAELIEERDKFWREKLERIEEIYFTGSNKYINLLSISGNANVFLFTDDDERLSNKLSLGTEAIINLSRVFGFWRGLEFWYKYACPKIKSSTTVSTSLTEEIDVDEEWNSHLNAVGASARFQMTETTTFIDGIRAGLGYFWVEGSAYNRVESSLYWDGINLNVEYFLGTPSIYYPFEFFVGSSVYHSFSNEMVFNTGFKDKPIKTGKTQFSFNAGIRYNFRMASY